MTFTDYVHSFYGRGGAYPLRKDGKLLTRTRIEALLPELADKMDEQGWSWGNGDTMDREFFRHEVLEQHGYQEGESNE
jgi:hypothetical protein